MISNKEIKSFYLHRNLTILFCLLTIISNLVGIIFVTHDIQLGWISVYFIWAICVFCWLWSYSQQKNYFDKILENYYKKLITVRMQYLEKLQEFENKIDIYNDILEINKLVNEKDEEKNFEQNS